MWVNWPSHIIITTALGVNGTEIVWPGEMLFFQQLLQLTGVCMWLGLFVVDLHTR